MANTQFSVPVLLEGDTPLVLNRISVHDHKEDEDWFEDQLFKLPSLLPKEQSAARRYSR